MRHPKPTSPAARPARLFVLAVLLGTTVITAAGSNPPTIAPAGQLVAGCPDMYAVNDEPPIWRRGDLVPAGATHATLCTYSYASLGIDALTLDRATTLPTERVAALVRQLNLLPAADRGYVHGCTLTAFEQHIIVLTYPDATAVPVRISTTCGTASYAGVIRRTNNLTPLLNHWNSSLPPDPGGASKDSVQHLPTLKTPTSRAVSGVDNSEAGSRQRPVGFGAAPCLWVGRPSGSRPVPRGRQSDRVALTYSDESRCRTVRCLRHERAPDLPVPLS